MHLITSRASDLSPGATGCGASRRTTYSIVGLVRRELEPT
jgi:hypothetical protein